MGVGYKINLSNDGDMILDHYYSLVRSKVAQLRDMVDICCHFQ